MIIYYNIYNILIIYIYIFLYSAKQKLHEHTQIKRKNLRHGQNTNTQKTEQNNTYQPRAPQGTQRCRQRSEPRK